MEVKTILRFIKDDIAHLEGITDAFSMESLPSSDEVQLALVRSNAVLKELELLHKLIIQRENSVNAVIPVEKPNVMLQEHDYSKHESFEIPDKETKKEDQENILNQIEKDPIRAVEELYINLSGTNDLPSEELPETPADNTPTEENIENIVENTESVDVALIIPTITEEEDEVHFTEQSVSDISYNLDANNQLIESIPEIIVDLNDAVAEEPAIAETVVLADIPDDKEEILAQGFGEIKKTLNETLADSHQMVNDVLSPEKSEQGYQTPPINSIWDGIGINDRFLFIRELFSNNNAKFETTVTALDKLTTIHEAVNYLKMNFKWNKSEASQKFLALVKRRFTK
jgi:hypothetical protein